MSWQRTLLAILASAASLFVSTPGWALGKSAEFRVSVSLNVLENGRCVSTTWSVKAQAEVQVVCTTGEFVDILPLPGKPAIGVHGAAYRYYMPSFPAGALVTNSDPYLGAGTITALRIYNVNGEDGPLEMLVSF